MSSEMMVTDAMVRAFVDSLPAVYAFDAPPPSAVRAGLEAAISFLARTEAGADEADLIQWRYTNVETGEVLTPWTECDAAFREKRKDAPGYQFRELFTHPQDASGDAEDAKRMDWLVANVTETLTAKSIRGEFPYPEHKTQYVLPRLIAWADFHGQVGFREAIDIAMQAKEAK